MKNFLLVILMTVAITSIADASVSPGKKQNPVNTFKIEKITTGTTQHATPAVTILSQTTETKMTASISFTDECGNELTVTGTCNSCTNISEWMNAFNNWWSANSSNGCYVEP